MCRLALEWHQPLDVIRDLDQAEWAAMISVVNERRKG